MFLHCAKTGKNRANFRIIPKTYTMILIMGHCNKLNYILYSFSFFKKKILLTVFERKCHVKQCNWIGT